MATTAGALSAGAQLLSRHRAAFCLGAFGLCASLAAAWLWRGRGRRRRRRRGALQQVGVVSQLYIYPVKSCKGTPLGEAECTKLGLQHGHLRDRHWALIKEDGHIVSGKQEPKLVLVSVSCEDGFLTLTAPDVEKLHIPLKLPRTNAVWNCRIFGHDVQGRDCGDEAARWINAYLMRSEPYRLVQFEPNMKLRDSKTEFVLYTRDDKTVYSDISPIMLLSEASLDDLNSRLDKKVKMQNFRPCIVVSGCSAFDEDSWDNLVIGSVELNKVMPCPRCIFTTVDPDTGIIDLKEPLNTLRSYRRCQTEDKKYYDSPPLNKAPLFGQYFGIERTGTLRVGDPVYKIVS